ncbi:MAG: hypothetical protein HZC02_03500 [Candidatus Levybacteria bacterium]|nr:hypothetical protein [Candidatus Levybacteria bacterium]
MEIIALFFIELFTLFFLSKSLHKKLSLVLYQLTQNITITTYTLAFFFFPGTLIHELSHYLTARLLFIHTGKMSLFPKREGDSIKLGSVEIARTDPFRRILVGISPFLMGTTIIVLSLFTFENQKLWNSPWAIVMLLYILFEIGNTMFSSKKDLEGTLFILIFIAILTILGYAAGFKIPFEEITHLLNQDVISTISKGCFYLLFPIGVNLILIISLYLLSQILQKRVL